MTELTSSSHQTTRPPARARPWMLSTLHATLALALLGGALSPPVHELAEHNVRLHHLQHAALLCGGGVLGLLLGRIMRRVAWRLLWTQRVPWRPMAAGVVLVGPVAVMFLMAPSTSSWTVEHPLMHILEHLLLIDLAALIGFSAALLSPAVGWLTVLLLAGMAAAFGGMAQAQPPSAPQAALSVPRQNRLTNPAPARVAHISMQTLGATSLRGSRRHDPIT